MPGALVELPDGPALMLGDPPAAVPSLSSAVTCLTSFVGRAKDLHALKPSATQGAAKLKLKLQPQLLSATHTVLLLSAFIECTGLQDLARGLSGVPKPSPVRVLMHLQ